MVCMIHRSVLFLVSMSTNERLSAEDQRSFQKGPYVHPGGHSIQEPSLKVHQKRKVMWSCCCPSPDARRKKIGMVSFFFPFHNVVKSSAHPEPYRNPDPHAGPARKKRSEEVTSRTREVLSSPKEKGREKPLYARPNMAGRPRRILRSSLVFLNRLAFLPLAAAAISNVLPVPVHDVPDASGISTLHSPDAHTW